MEPDTVTKPKINKTTFKIGNGSLADQVANNSKKIVLLRKVFQKQNTRINDDIKPSVNNLRESLLETNIILTDISEVIQRDYKDRIKILQDQIKDDTKKFQDQKRKDQESNLEKTKRVNKIGKKVGAALAKPFVGLFDQLTELGVILGTGLIANNVIKFVTDPKNAEKVEQIFTSIKNNAGAILTAGGILAGLGLVGGGGTIFKFLKFFFKRLLIPMAKFFTTGLGVILLPLMLGGSSKKGQNLQTNTNLSQNFNKFLEKEDKDKRFGGIFVTDQGPFSVFESEFYQRPEIRAITDKAAKLSIDNKISKDDYHKVLLALKRVMIDEFIRTFEDGKYLKKEGVDKFLLENSSLPKFQFGGFSHGLGIVEPGEFVIKKSVVDKIGLAKLYATNSGMNLSESNIFFGGDLDPIYMNMEESKINNVPATQVLRVSSANVNNNYMKETPTLFGFSDLVYT